MKLSAPLFRLKREARLLAREHKIPLHQALDRIAVREGFSAWSLLAATAAAQSPASKVYARLEPGDLMLIGARPGHGKTLLALELAVEAMKAGHRGVFFTFEYTERDVLARFRDIGAERDAFGDRFVLDDSDAISADHIMTALADAPRGTFAVVDYLQLLDQKRENPALAVQVQMLNTFARARGIVLIFISQIDRSYDAAKKPFPDMADIRLPNPLDMSLFSKTCFLNAGELRFSAAH